MGLKPLAHDDNVSTLAGKQRWTLGSPGGHDLARIPIQRLALLSSLLLVLFQSSAIAQAPELGGLLPAGGPRGATTRVQISGKNLQGAKLHIGGAGVHLIGVQTTPGGDNVTAEILVDPGARLGPRDVRIANSKGISNGARFWVDVLPNRVIAKPMTEGVPPELIDGASPAVINSRIAAKSGRDQFTFSAQAGEIWTFQCLADEIRSRMDPVLELKDEAGISLRLAQGAWESDPRFFYRFTKAGRYFLTVRDSEYNGGPNFTYRLLAGKLPFVAGFLPLGERPGHRADVAMRGVNLPTERAAIAIPSDASGVYWAEVSVGSSGSLVLPMLVDSDPVVDAGDQQGIRTLTSLPVAVDGVFLRSPVCRFGFHAAAGAKLSFDLLGRRLGSRIDGAVRILDAAGKELASNDDAPNLGKDARLEFTAPATADYQAEVRNVEEITGADCFYRLKVRPVVPDFQVAIATDRLTVPAGGTVAIPMTLERSGGFEGPVTVRAEGLPPTVTLRGGLFPAGKNSIEVTLTATPDAVFSATGVHLIAEALMSGHSVLRVREAPGWERYEHRSIDLLLSVEYSYTRPHHLWDLLLLAVTDRTDPITVSSTATEISLTPGAAVEIPIRVLRHPSVMGEVKLDIRGLPGKVTAAAAVIPAGQTDGKIVLTAAADAPLDVVGLIVQAHLGNTVCLAPAIPLTVHK